MTNVSPIRKKTNLRETLDFVMSQIYI